VGEPAVPELVFVRDPKTKRNDIEIWQDRCCNASYEESPGNDLFPQTEAQGKRYRWMEKIVGMTIS
jgi:hypothetical protein